MIQHLICTRMAVGNPSPDWLGHRLAIFERYCVPSVRAQTNRDFTWLLAVSNRCPQTAVERIRCVAPFAQIVPVRSPRAWWGRLVHPFLVRGARLLTTRLDNDDAIHREFVATIQARAAGCPDGTVVDAAVGYQMRLDTGSAGSNGSRGRAPSRVWSRTLA